MSTVIDNKEIYWNVQEIYEKPIAVQKNQHPCGANILLLKRARNGAKYQPTILDVPLTPSDPDETPIITLLDTFTQNVLFKFSAICYTVH